jgi:hypothetical protein
VFCCCCAKKKSYSFSNFLFAFDNFVCLRLGNSLETGAGNGQEGIVALVLEAIAKITPELPEILDSDDEGDAKKVEEEEAVK